MPRSSVLLCLVLSLVAVTTTAPAWTVGPPAGDGSKPGVQVTEYLRRAARARKAGQWAEAADAYRAAWGLEQQPELAGELGVCEVALGRYREAAEHLQISMEKPESLSQEQLRRFESAQARAEREVATVVISANPPNAQVSVDDQPPREPRSTYIIFLEPGRHTLRAQLDGYEDARVTLDAVPGTSPEIPLRLRERRPPSKPSAPPLRCRPGTDCGGKLANTLRYVGFATAGAGLAAGAGMVMGAAVLQNEMTNRAATVGPNGCWGKGALNPCKNLVTLREARNMLAGGAVLTFIGAGVVAGVTVSSFWWAPGPRAEGPIRVAPAVSRNEAGLTIYGGW